MGVRGSGRGICTLRPPHFPDFSSLQIPEEVGFRCDPRPTLGLGRPALKNQGHGRAWLDSLGVCVEDQGVGWGVWGGGGHGAPPAAAGPLGLPAQPRALAGIAAS